MEFDFNFFTEPKTDIQKRTDKYLIESFKIIKLLNDIIKIPRENHVTNVITKRTFNAFNFIHFFIDKFKIIDELIVTTYSINLKYVNSVCMFKNEGIIKDCLIVYNSNSTSVRKETSIIINQLLKESNIKYLNNLIHSKIYLMKSKSNYIVITGSGNWNVNGNIENYVLFNNEKIYNFYKDFIENIDHIEKM